MLKRRWVVERIPGRFSNWGGLRRERAGRLDVVTGRLTFSAKEAGMRSRTFKQIKDFTPLTSWYTRSADRRHAPLSA